MQKFQCFHDAPPRYEIAPPPVDPNSTIMPMICNLWSAIYKAQTEFNALKWCIPRYEEFFIDVSLHIESRRHVADHFERLIYMEGKTLADRAQGLHEELEQLLSDIESSNLKLNACLCQHKVYYENRKELVRYYHGQLQSFKETASVLERNTKELQYTVEEKFGLPSTRT